jgi:type IV pilus assembly protein PilW
MRNLHLHRQRGFSLIEILIGMLIAMVGVVIMMEVLLTSEQRTRTSTSGNDAMSNGAVTMHMLQRDLLQAGYGINAMSLLGCNLTLPNAKVVKLAPIEINPPVALVPEADPNTDTMLVFYGSDNGQPEGNIIYSVDGAEYTVQAPSAFEVDDYVVASTGTCGAGLVLARVTAVAAMTVTVNTGVAGATVLHNMGKAPRVVAYAVRNGALTSCDLMTAGLNCSVDNAVNWPAVAGNIVSLRAQYGHDAVNPMEGAIDNWSRVSPTTACGWARAPAVRFALVARSTQYETEINAAGQRVGEVVTGEAPKWAGTLNAVDAANLAPIDLTLNPDETANTDWQFYRYRTFENLAPTRNVVWMGAQAGC